MRRFLSRLANLFRGRQAEREMNRELESHLALLRESFEGRGLAPQAADRAARLALGGVTQAKQLHRETRAFVFIEQFLQDIRYACRNLLRNPGFTLVAALALALGLGANLSVFSIYNAIALKPLPVAEADRVVRIKRWFATSQDEPSHYGFTLSEYQLLRDRSAAFASIVAMYGGLADDGAMSVAASLPGAAASERLTGRAVSANYFASLGVPAAIGRTFRPDEDRAPNGNPVLVLSHRFWQRRFQGDPEIIGQTVKLNGLAYSIVGVAPPKFTGTDLLPFQFDFYAPLSMLAQLQLTSHAPQPVEPGVRNLHLLARLKSGVTRAQAQAETDALLRRYLAGFHETERTTAVTLERTTYVGPDNPGNLDAAYAIVSSIVSLVLLVACANVANMLLARGAARRREVAVRQALGASRGRMVRQLLMESVLLALLGGAAAIPLATWTSQWFWASIDVMFRGMVSLAQIDLSPDFRVLAYGLALSLLTGIVFGIVPALRFTRADLNSAIKDEASVLGARFSRSRLRGILLGAQAAVSLLLLLNTGDSLSLLSKSSATDPGFDVTHTYLVMFEGEITHKRLREALASVPEVAATAIGDIPLMSNTMRMPMRAGAWNRETIASHESDGYFETMGIPLLRGRSFTRQETANGATVAVISEATARLCWPRQDPVGKHMSLRLGKDKFYDFEVIGVARDVRHADLDEIDPLHVYLPTDGTKGTFLGGLIFRILGDRGRALAAVQAALGDIDRSLLPSLQLVQVAAGPLAMQRGFNRVIAIVAGTLTLVALVLASVGIYGVMTFLVSQRTREIGVRMALGATTREILKNVVTQGLRPVFIGMAAGLLAALAEDAWDRSTDLVPETMLQSVLGNPQIYCEVALMLAVAVLASAIPARRAMRVDPMVALRHE